MFGKALKVKFVGVLALLSLTASVTFAAAPMCSQILASFTKHAIFLTHDNKKMAFKLSGKENAKRVVLFLNGLDKSYNEWNDVRDLVEAKKSDTLFVQLDMLGQGQTAKLTPNSSDVIRVEDQIRMLYEFIKTHGYEERDLIIVGHSYGGGIAGRFIHDHPNMVKRAVLIAPFVDNLETYHGAMGSMMATMKVVSEYAGLGFIYQSTLQMTFATGASLSWSRSEEHTSELQSH